MWVTTPRNGQEEGKREEEGGRELQRPAEREDLPANGVKHRVNQD